MNLMDDLRVCPKCGGDDLDVDSSREMRVSHISCLNCGYVLNRNIPENWLTLLWNLIPRKHDAPKGDGAEEEK